MKRFALILVAVAAALSTRAQREAHIGYVYPAGGRQGTTFEAVIGGANLAEATEVVVSGRGVHAAIVKQERQVTPKEQQELKEQLGKIKEKRMDGEPLSAEDMKMAAEAKEKLTAFGRRLANPSLGEFVTIAVTVDTNAVLEAHELRLLSRAGLSNPRTFMVGALPEVSKSDWKNVPKSRSDKEPRNVPHLPPVAVKLPVTINGQIPPGGVDTYTFDARAGQHVVVAVRARDLIPYLADAVPGWMQAAVTLYDAQGREVAFADDYKFHPDPVIFYAIPKDGTYALKIRDSLYRGREDFVYRMTVGEVPFVTGVFPAGGRVGTKTAVGISGWNLPVRQTELDFSGAMPGIVPFQVCALANAMPLQIDTLPETVEREPNNGRTNAMEVTLPVIVNGRIDAPGDWDAYRFEGLAGQQVVAEVFARRLDSPMDSMLRLFDPKGRQVACNDDREDKASGLDTHHADSYLSVRLLSDGAYTLFIGDTQRGGGPAYGYRLRLGAPRPDFELRVVPSALNVRAGASVAVTAYALRKDGFTNEIALALTDAPKGYRLAGAVIPANGDQATFTLTAPLDASSDPVPIAMEGRAHVGGRAIARKAVPADDMMQAFAYRHLVPAREQLVTAVGKMRARFEMAVLSPMPLQLAVGKRARLSVRVPGSRFMSDIAYELVNPPEGVRVESGTEDSITLAVDASLSKVGRKGFLILAVTGQPLRTESGKERPVANKVKVSLGAFPAIPYEVVP